MDRKPTEANPQRRRQIYRSGVEQGNTEDFYEKFANMNFPKKEISKEISKEDEDYYFQLQKERAQSKTRARSRERQPNVMDRPRSPQSYNIIERTFPFVNRGSDFVFEDITEADKLKSLRETSQTTDNRPAFLKSLAEDNTPDPEYLGRTINVYNRLG